MRIDEDLCIACEECLSICPLDVISMEGAVAVIDRDECAECGVCFRSGVCPVDAFIDEPSPWPRSLRAQFSNPLALFESGMAGRGTEEMKTNDVTGRFRRGHVGIGIELGRPGTGCRFHDVDKVARAMAKLGTRFEPSNPLTSLIEDVGTGKIKEEVLNEKVLSAIIECEFPVEKLKDVLASLDEVAKEVDCVFSIDCVARAEPDGSLPVEKLLLDLGIPYYIDTKTNVGLGRPLAEGGER